MRAKQYPYQLQVLTQTPAHQDENGNWVPGTEQWVTHSTCRDESGTGQKKLGIDGVEYIVSFIVQMPRGTDGVKVGAKIKVVHNNEIRCSGQVLYSRVGQFHTQLWA